MATEKISEIEYPLGKKSGVLEWLFESKLDLFLDTENRKFFGTLRIGSYLELGLQLTRFSFLRYIESSFKRELYASDINTGKF